MTKKFENFGTALSREQMKKIMGGCGMGEFCDDGDDGCKDTCVSNSDCPADRQCATGDCQGIIVKTCFRY